MGSKSEKKQSEKIAKNGSKKRSVVIQVPKSSSKKSGRSLSLAQKFKKTGLEVPEFRQDFEPEKVIVKERLIDSPKKPAVVNEELSELESEIKNERVKVKKQDQKEKKGLLAKLSEIREHRRKAAEEKEAKGKKEQEKADKESKLKKEKELKLKQTQKKQERQQKLTELKTQKEKMEKDKRNLALAKPKVEKKESKGFFSFLTKKKETSREKSFAIPHPSELRSKLKQTRKLEVKKAVLSKPKPIKVKQVLSKPIVKKEGKGFLGLFAKKEKAKLPKPIKVPKPVKIKKPKPQVIKKPKPSQGFFARFKKPAQLFPARKHKSLADIDTSKIQSISRDLKGVNRQLEQLREREGGVFK